MFADPEAWSSNFQASFKATLSMRERLALPGQQERVRWTGGDATLTSIGAVDWEGGGSVPAYLVAEARPLIEQLQKTAPGMAYAEEAEIISVVELLAYVVLAAVQGGEWKDRLVFYVTDNQNVQAWIEERKAKNAVARHLLRILVRLEASYGF